MGSPYANKNGSLRAGLGILAFSVLACTIGPLFLPYDPLVIAPENALRPPSIPHLLGTDELGRDVLIRLLIGGRVILLIVGVGVMAGAFAGCALGAAAGWQRGWLELICMRGVDALMAFPGFLIALAAATIMGPGPLNLALSLAVYAIPGFARFAYAQTLWLKERGYIEAARSFGMPHGRILLKHVLPSALASLMVLVSVRLSGALLTASGLSFLGLGILPPTPEWGAMLNAGREYVWVAPWLVIVPGAAIFVVAVGLNMLGDGLARVWNLRT